MKHIVHDIFLSPRHKITIDVIGAGGTGSLVVAHLGRIHKALQALEHPGLHVRLIDDDKVSESNIGRQNFAKQDIGLYKCQVLIERYNRFYGTEWEAIPKRVIQVERGANIVIGCVDTIQARRDISNNYSQIDFDGGSDEWPIYWIDCGNSRNSGQVLVGGLSMTNTKLLVPTTNLLMDLGVWDMEEDEDTPSCSTAEALLKQDIMVNTFAASYAASYVWDIVRKGILLNQGLFYNLETMKNSVIPLKEKEA